MKVLGPLFKSFFAWCDKKLILIALGILVFRWAVYEPYVIPSGSMIPSLLIYDHIIVNKYSYGLHVPFSPKWIFQHSEPKRGDVVVFRPKQEKKGMKFMVKRVVGLPGEKIYIDEQDQVWINGQALKRTLLAKDREKNQTFYPITERDLGAPYGDYNFFEEIPVGTTAKGTTAKSTTVEGATAKSKPTYRVVLKKGHFSTYSEKEFELPTGFVFVMGDNRDSSADSREWGALPINHIMGKAVLIWLSCEDIFWLPLFCHPDKIRFGRFFKQIF